MTTVVFCADIPFDYLTQRPQIMAHIISERRPVLYVEPRYVAFGIRTVDDNLRRLLVPTIPYNTRMGKGIVFRIGRLFRWPIAIIQYLAIRFATHWDPVIVFNQALGFTDAIRMLPRTFLWYDCIDNPFGFTELPPYCDNQLLWLLKNADVVSTSHWRLTHMLQDRHEREYVYLSNGVDIGAYHLPGSSRDSGLGSATTSGAAGRG